MATSAFKSTTKRASIGGSSSENSSSASRSLRRSRSLSRFSRSIEPEQDYVTQYNNKNAPREEFLDPAKEPMHFPDISLDDLALEFFSLSSGNENGSNGRVERKEREGRSVSRQGELGRLDSDTASSRRKGRSVSRPRGDVVSSSSTSRAKNVSSYDTGSRRRRSLSVAHFQPSDSEGEVDRSRNTSNRANVKASISGNGQMPKATSSINQRLRRAQSHKNLHVLRDDYSSHSSTLTDDQSKDTCLGKNGFEKIIRAICEQKKEMGRHQAALTSGHFLQSDSSEAFQDFSKIRKKYSAELEQLEKRKHHLLTEMLIEEQRGRQVSKMVKELPDSRTSAAAEKPSRAQKRSSDKHRMTKRLTEAAEKYLDDFITNVEDTDLSSFDGERSDGSSVLGGTTRPRDSTIKIAENYKSATGSTSYSVETDGVTLPWLKWEIGQRGSLSGDIKAHTPLTPKALQWDSEKGVVSLHDLSNQSNSSCGIWSQGLLSSPPTDKTANDFKSWYDSDEHLKKLGKNEELLIEMYIERNKISSGCLLLCAGALY